MYVVVGVCLKGSNGIFFERKTTMTDAKTRTVCNKTHGDVNQKGNFHKIKMNYVWWGRLENETQNPTLFRLSCVCLCMCE